MIQLDIYSESFKTTCSMLIEMLLIIVKFMGKNLDVYQNMNEENET